MKLARRLPYTDNWLRDKHLALPATIHEGEGENMSQYIRRISVPLFAGLILAGAACGDRNGDDALARDTSLSRDLELAGRDTLAQPALTDTFPATPPAAQPTPPSAPVAAAPRTPPRATTPRPSTPAPRPSTPSTPTTTPSGNTVTPGTGTPARETGTIPSGTQLVLASTQQVCTNTHRVGDRLTARLSQSVTGTNGAVIPAGATAVLRITELKRSENANDDIRMGFEIVSISHSGTTYAVSGQTTGAEVTRVRSSTGRDDAKKVVGGAVIGAIAGQVLGKDTKSTVIGAATGAAAGTAAAAATANFEGCVNDGARITIATTSPVTVQV